MVFPLFQITRGHYTFPETFIKLPYVYIYSLLRSEPKSTRLSFPFLTFSLNVSSLHSYSVLDCLPTSFLSCEHRPYKFLVYETYTSHTSNWIRNPRSFLKLYVFLSTPSNRNLDWIRHSWVSLDRLCLTRPVHLTSPPSFADR